MLRTIDVTFGYGAAPVVCGVSMDVRDRGIAGIIGPNGSGKTTLLRLLAGTRRPQSGRVEIEGHDLAKISRPALAQRMAVVPQETHLAFDYTVLEVVMMGRYPHLATFELEGPADYQAARRALKATGTEALESRQFATLSGGEKQRVVIAAALAQISGTRQGAAPVLLLDEPTAALDLAYQLETAALLRDLQTSLPISIVISTHDLNFAASLCESLVLLRAGRVLASGPTPSVLTPTSIRDLYGVDADVHLHATTGHLVVVPIRRSGGTAA